MEKSYSILEIFIFLILEEISQEMSNFSQPQMVRPQPDLSYSMSSMPATGKSETGFSICLNEYDKGTKTVKTILA